MDSLLLMSFPLKNIKLVLLGDSSAEVSSLSFALALREANMSGITIVKMCGFVANTLLPTVAWNTTVFMLEQ